MPLDYSTIFAIGFPVACIVIAAIVLIVRAVREPDVSDRESDHKNSLKILNLIKSSDAPSGFDDDELSEDSVDECEDMDEDDDSDKDDRSDHCTSGMLRREAYWQCRGCDQEFRLSSDNTPVYCPYCGDTLYLKTPSGYDTNSSEWLCEDCKERFFLLDGDDADFCPLCRSQNISEL